MGTSLKRTTIFLSEDQHEKLRQLAFDQRTSMAKLLRDAALEGQKAFSEEQGSIHWSEYKKQRQG
jgi:hypothetical protein